jgi:hypothetical protein
MEANGSQHPLPSRNLSADVDHESLQPQPSGARSKGGWITFPFLAVAMLGLGVARGGATSNFVVYLVKKYNVPRVDAAQISSIALGCLSLAPVGGAIVADAFFGCYPVVAVSMVFSVLVSTALVTSYLPACTNGQWIRIPNMASNELWSINNCARAGLGHVHPHGEPARPPSGGVPSRRRPVRADLDRADGGAVRRGVHAVRQRGGRPVQPGDPGREPVRRRGGPRRALQLVLRLLLRLLRGRLHRHRLRPGQRVVGARLRHLRSRQLRGARRAARRHAVLPTARRAGQPVHGAREGGPRRGQEMESQLGDVRGAEVLPRTTEQCR